MRVSVAALPGRKEHDAEGECAGRDGIGIIVLSRSARPDKPVLRTPRSFILGIYKSIPVRYDIFERFGIALHHGFESHIRKLGRPLMPQDSHPIILA
jgi:hypothetical protein